MLLITVKAVKGNKMRSSFQVGLLLYTSSPPHFPPACRSHPIIPPRNRKLCSILPSSVRRFSLIYYMCERARPAALLPALTPFRKGVEILNSLLPLSRAVVSGILQDSEPPCDEIRNYVIVTLVFAHTKSFFCYYLWRWQQRVIRLYLNV